MDAVSPGPVARGTRTHLGNEVPHCFTQHAGDCRLLRRSKGGGAKPIMARGDQLKNLSNEFLAVGGAIGRRARRSSPCR